MAVGRRVLIRNAALLAATGGCARRIPPSPDVTAEVDELFQVHLPAAAAPQLQKEGGSVAVHLRFASGGEVGFGILIANLGSTFAAFSRDCPHAGCELTYVPEDRQVECPCHGSRFATDGSLLNPPAASSLNVYPLTVDAAGDFHVRIFPGDGTYPLPGPDRKLVLDLASYPQLSQVHGSVLGRVEGPPGPLIVTQYAPDKYAALTAVCPHRQCVVGPKPDGVLHCPCHGSEFRLATDGTQTVTGLAAPTALRGYPVTVAGNALTIDLQ